MLLAVNVFFFTLMWQTSGLSFSLLNPLPNTVLVAFGAKLNYYIQAQHQWWRFVTPMFLHVNVLHLSVNMYSLWIIGPYVEKLYGSAKFVCLLGADRNSGSGCQLSDRQAEFGWRDPVAVSFSKPMTSLQPELPAPVWTGRRAVCFRHQVSSRIARRFQARVWHRLAADDLSESIHRLRGSGFIDNAAHLGGFASARCWR